MKMFLLYQALFAFHSANEYVLWKLERLSESNSNQFERR